MVFLRRGLSPITIFLQILSIHHAMIFYYFMEQAKFIRFGLGFVQAHQKYGI
jgi:hypothetical protein